MDYALFIKTLAVSMTSDFTMDPIPPFFSRALARMENLFSLTIAIPPCHTIALADQMRSCQLFWNAKHYL